MTKPNHEHSEDVLLWLFAFFLLLAGFISWFSFDSRLSKLECQADPVCMEQRDDS